MIFFTSATEPRPVRLRESTRQWAWESLHGKYGDEARKTPAVCLDDIPGIESMDLLGRYNAAVRKIAEEAPLRLCPEERVCGAATLGDALYHHVPAVYRGESVCYSVSHLTLDFESVLKKGLNAYEREIRERLRDPALTHKKIRFLNSLLNVINSIRRWHRRYLDATETERPDLHALLQQVPFDTPRSFHEALQSLWFTFAFTRLCGNWPGIGRLDVLLGDYLKRDLEAGVLDRDEARELLASFFIKGCEWIESHTAVGSGDAQHYQNIVLAGIDEDGNEVTNEVTYLVLEVVEELTISDFPITMRLNADTPAPLKETVARIMRHGGGVVAIYNEDLILRGLDSLGYEPDEARRFANDGCWEIQIPGKTDFAYYPLDALQLLNKAIGVTDDTLPALADMDAVYAAFAEQLQATVDELYRTNVSAHFTCVDGEWQRIGDGLPSSVISLFENDCIQNARSYYDCGPRYIVRSPHIGGAPDVANSLYAIQQLVFEEKRLTLPELVTILRNNWEGEELLRLHAKNDFVYYGNDADEVDDWHSRVLNDFADVVRRYDRLDGCPVRFIPGVSTFGRQIEWLPYRCATAFGYRQGDILSGNDSPCPGTDTGGATAIIRSHCKADLVKQTCGAALDIKIFPESLSGDNGLVALCALMDGFLKLNGSFMQVDTVDTQTLLEAQRDPQKFKTLSVRVSGWNARFVTLNREWQEMIIQRSAQDIG